MIPIALPQHSSGFKIEMIEGEILLYHLEDNSIYYLNQTAALIWHLCDGRRTVDEIITKVSEAYPESAGTIAGDVENILQQFLEFGAIKRG